MKEDPLILWMTQVAKGDQTAFRHLVAAVGQRLFRQAYHLCGGDRAMAEDALQEVLIKLWRYAPRWQPSGKVESYLGQMVFTTCMDLHRKRKPTQEIDAELPSSQNVHEEVVQRQRRSQILTAVGKLPHRQRSAIQLFYFAGFSQQEVASALKSSEKAVESLLIRGRRKLSDLLPRQLLDEGRSS